MPGYFPLLRDVVHYGPFFRRPMRTLRTSASRLELSLTSICYSTEATISRRKYKKRRAPLTDAERSAVLSKIKEGLPFSQIGAEFGISLVHVSKIYSAWEDYGTIARVARENRCKRGEAREKIESQRSVILSKIEEGIMHRKIALEAGVTMTQLQSVLRIWRKEGLVIGIQERRRRELEEKRSVILSKFEEGFSYSEIADYLGIGCRRIRLAIESWKEDGIPIPVQGSMSHEKVQSQSSLVLSKIEKGFPDEQTGKEPGVASSIFQHAILPRKEDGTITNLLRKRTKGRPPQGQELPTQDETLEVGSVTKMVELRRSEILSMVEKGIPYLRIAAELGISYSMLISATRSWRLQGIFTSRSVRAGRQTKGPRRLEILSKLRQGLRYQKISTELGISDQSLRYNIATMSQEGTVTESLLEQWRRDAILSNLDKGLTRQQIATELGYSYGYIRKLVADMVEDGTITNPIIPGHRDVRVRSAISSQLGKGLTIQQIATEVGISYFSCAQTIYKMRKEGAITDPHAVPRAPSAPRKKRKKPSPPAQEETHPDQNPEDTPN